MDTNQSPIRVAIVAGEASGDLLGAGLMRELKKLLPNIEWTGIGGPEMIREGFNSMIDMQRLSVMGISDTLLHYPKLFQIRKTLHKEWQDNPPDVFIGVDYPYFNLSLELRLKKLGIKTVHLVSPKIWAWRQKRVFYIKEAVDLILTLFPFEEALYQKYAVPVHYIGHPLADQIDLHIDAEPIKKQLGFSSQDKIISVLPGSRTSEIKYMGPLFLDVMHELSIKIPELQFVVPTANSNLKALFFQQMQSKGYDLKLKILDGQSREAMIASDFALVKSGTATLEAMLLKRPMVVAFKWSALNHAIIAPQVKIPFISLPNILANEELIPEFIQSKALAKPIAQKVLQLFDAQNTETLKNQFASIHQGLRQNANEKAALAIYKLLKPFQV
ncbi:lipid-A-disaccharide synthase [Legionella parisiensis]|uniref:Lipid-A-disaccharide synthase n=1 Tax=Legionella parisiensis TaxID=45071 RepID=A0A1E5JTR0_9GAMM|nr:lipid-A-disaccharide synthase [Legionella parisiensis]KTD43185.1 lipid-A-disaccharide synthase [Legionella parisiensis]OEH47458.1 Lipid-A-disaccharide synthase [Legionella parisiensis]STX77734.1 lipid-A-disaccharide synthase [Legionella parisiensis]